MSNLERDFMKAKLGKLPLQPPDLGFDQDDDEAEEELDEVAELGGSSSSVAGSSRYEPLSGADFFEEALNVTPPASQGATFRVYYTAPRQSRAEKGEKPTVMVFCHGAGFSGLSFGQTAAHLRSSSTSRDLGFAAVDARGHGKTSGGDESAMSIDQLAQDLTGVIQELFPDEATAPKLLLVGHSMGGAIVVHACPLIQKFAQVMGVAVLDVVEGSAIEALAYMDSFLANQPKGFQSVPDAIKWHMSSNTLRNLDSARVSCPPILKQMSQDEQEQHELPPVVWRANLRLSEPHWQGWFQDMSKNFLALKTAKLLILAGTDRLDTELTIGQMQGKFQLSVMPDVGHSLHEDDPRRTAQLLRDFWSRNDREVLKGVKKIGEM